MDCTRASSNTRRVPSVGIAAIARTLVKCSWVMSGATHVSVTLVEDVSQEQKRSVRTAAAPAARKRRTRVFCMKGRDEIRHERRAGQIGVGQHNTLARGRAITL